MKNAVESVQRGSGTIGRALTGVFYETPLEERSNLIELILRAPDEDVHLYSRLCAAVLNDRERVQKDKKRRREEEDEKRKEAEIEARVEKWQKEIDALDPPFLVVIQEDRFSFVFSCKCNFNHADDDCLCEKVTKEWLYKEFNVVDCNDSFIDMSLDYTPTRFAEIVDTMRRLPEEFKPIFTRNKALKKA